MMAPQSDSLKKHINETMRGLLKEDKTQMTTDSTCDEKAYQMFIKSHDITSVSPGLVVCQMGKMFQLKFKEL